MKIVQITPGTGTFYCGCCIRDNALVIEWRRQGHEALMVPLYLPFVTDEIDAEHSEIFMGGINVYLQHVSGLFRKTPRWIDRWFDSPSLLRWSARKAEMTVPSELGDMTLSTLRGEEGRQAKEMRRLVDWLKSRIKPDVICLSNALLVGMVWLCKSEIDAPVVCTLQGEDHYLDALREPYRTECWNLLAERAAQVDGWIPVSRNYGEVMRARLRLDPHKVHPVWNGISLKGFDEPAPSSSSPTVGYLARMCPEKGLDRLVDAFLELKKKPQTRGIRLCVIGTMTEGDRAYVARERNRLMNAGVSSDVEFHPNVDRPTKINLLKALSLLSVPVRMAEAFGLYAVEAMACGVPVVLPDTGAFPELLERTGGGILFDVNDPSSYLAGLERFLLNPNEARLFGERGRNAVFEYFHIERMAGEISDVFESLIEKRSNGKSESKNDGLRI